MIKELLSICVLNKLEYEQIKTLETMNDFLSNPEERISSFQGTVEKALAEDEKTDVIPAKKEKKSINKKQSRRDDSHLTNDKYTFSIKLSKVVELSVRKALLDIFESTGEKINIQQFISTSILFYIEYNRKKHV